MRNSGPKDNVVSWLVQFDCVVGGTLELDSPSTADQDGESGGGLAVGPPFSRWPRSVTRPFHLNIRRVPNSLSGDEVADNPATVGDAVKVTVFENLSLCYHPVIIGYGLLAVNTAGRTGSSCGSVEFFKISVF